jgi:hypothetical protein
VVREYVELGDLNYDVAHIRILWRKRGSGLNDDTQGARRHSTATDRIQGLDNWSGQYRPVLFLYLLSLQRGPLRRAVLEAGDDVPLLSAAILCIRLTTAVLECVVSGCVLALFTHDCNVSGIFTVGREDERRVDDRQC